LLDGLEHFAMLSSRSRFEFNQQAIIAGRLTHNGVAMIANFLVLANAARINGHPTSPEC
jgi:hypothetical protein